jgi:transcriptional regulator with XRE-family HTH domain
MHKSLFSKEYRIFLGHLRKARAEAGLTQAGLAKRLGETQSFISKVERGERRLDVVELRAFCRALKMAFPTFINRLHLAITVGERHSRSKSS